MAKRYLGTMALLAVFVAAPATANTGDTCDDAIAVQVSAVSYGDFNTMNTSSAIPAVCYGDEASGADMFYSLAVSPGFRYDVEIQPASTLNVAAAVWTDCTLADAACIAGVDDGLDSARETMSFEPEGEGTYIIQVVGVDAVTGATTSTSKFSMKVTETAVAGEDIGGEDIATEDDVIVGEDSAVAGEDTAGAVADTTGAGNDDVDAETGATGLGCGQGDVPSAAAVTLLLVALVAIRRFRVDA